MRNRLNMRKKAQRGEKEELARESSDPKILAELAKDEDDDVRWEVAANFSTSSETLAELAKDPAFDVRQSVAHNLSTSPETLAELAKDDDAWVRLLVAKNPNTLLTVQQEILKVLEKDETFQKEWKDDNEKELTEETMEASPYAELLRKYTADEIFDIASGRKEATEEEVIQAKEVITRGIVAGKLSMRKKAQDENIDEDFGPAGKDRDGKSLFIGDLVEIISSAEIENLVGVPGVLPDDDITLLEGEYGDIRKVNLDGNILLDLDAGWEVTTSPWNVRKLKTSIVPEKDEEKEKLAENPSTLPETLTELAKDEDAIVRRNVGKNPSTLPETLTELAKDKNKYVRLYVAYNPSTPSETLAELAKDEDKFVRRNVARNPSTPSALQQKVLKVTEEPVETIEVPYADLLNKYTEDEIFDIASGRKEATEEEVEQAKEVITREIVSNRLSMRKKAYMDLGNIRKLYLQQSKTPGVYDHDLLVEIQYDFLEAFHAWKKDLQKQQEDAQIRLDEYTGGKSRQFGGEDLENWMYSEDWSESKISKALELEEQVDNYYSIGESLNLLIPLLENANVDDQIMLAIDRAVNAIHYRLSESDPLVLQLVNPQEVIEIKKLLDDIFNMPYYSPLHEEEQLEKELSQMRKDVEVSNRLSMRKFSQSTPETIQKAQAGDENAIAQVIEENIGLISQALINWGHTPKSDEFEDVMSDIKVEMLNRIIPQYDPSKGAFSTFLSTAVYNFLRRGTREKEYKEKQKEVSLAEPVEEGITLEDTLEDKTSEVVQMTLSSARENLQNWLHTQKPELEEVVLRIFDLKVEEYSHERIAEALNQEGYTSKGKSFTRTMVNNYVNDWIKPALAQFFEAFKTAKLSMRKKADTKKPLTYKQVTDLMLIIKDLQQIGERVLEIDEVEDLSKKLYSVFKNSEVFDMILEKAFTLEEDVTANTIIILIGDYLNFFPIKGMKPYAKELYENLDKVCQDPSNPKHQIKKVPLKEVFKTKEEDEEEEEEWKEKAPSVKMKTELTEETMEASPYAELLRKYTADEIFDIASGRKEATEEEIQMAKDVITRGIVSNRLSMRKESKKLLIKDRIKLAEEPSTPPETLAELAKDKYMKVRWRVASNPSTPLEALVELSKDEDEYVRQHTAINKSTPTEILVELSKDQYFEVLRGVAMNFSTPPETLVELSKDEHFQVRQSVALNPSTPLETLVELSKDKNWLPRRYVALNPSTPIEVLVELSRDESEFVRRNVAENSSTPVETLVELAKDEKKYVRRNVALNPSTPPEIQEQIKKEPDYKEEIGTGKIENIWGELYEYYDTSGEPDTGEKPEERLEEVDEEMFKVSPHGIERDPSTKPKKEPISKTPLTEVVEKYTPEILDKYTEDEIFDIASGRKEATEEEVEQAKDVITRGIVSNRLSMRKKGTFGTPLSYEKVMDLVMIVKDLQQIGQRILEVEEIGDLEENLYNIFGDNIILDDVLKVLIEKNTTANTIIGIIGEYLATLDTSELNPSAKEILESLIKVCQDPSAPVHQIKKVPPKEIFKTKKEDDDEEEKEEWKAEKKPLKVDQELTEETMEASPYAELLRKYTADEIFDIASGRKEATEEEVEQAKEVITREIVSNRLSMRKKAYMDKQMFFDFYGVSLLSDQYLEANPYAKQYKDTVVQEMKDVYGPLITKMCYSELKKHTNKVWDWGIWQEEFDIRKVKDLTLEQVAIIYNEGLWRSAYGGKPWGHITESLIQLKNTTDTNQLITIIDHINDIQHNTGLMFHDFPKVEEWFSDALDVKVQSTPEGLIPYLSTDLQKLVIEDLKLKGQEVVAPEKYLTMTEKIDQADNPNTPPETLAELAKDEDEELQLAVAANPNTPPETLTELAKNEHINVREAVAYNPNTPPEIKEQLKQAVNLSMRKKGK